MSADKLSIGWYPCAVRVMCSNGDGDRPVIPDSRYIPSEVGEKIKRSQEFGVAYARLTKALEDDGGSTTTVEEMLNRVRALRDPGSWRRLRIESAMRGARIRIPW